MFLLGLGWGGVGMMTFLALKVFFACTWGWPPHYLKFVQNKNLKKAFLSGAGQCINSNKLGEHKPQTPT